MTKKNEVATISDRIDELEQVADECGSIMVDTAGRFRKAFIVAGAIQRLEALMTDDIMKQVFMPLQGSKLGFVTDKDKDGGYDIPVVRKCMIEGILRGLRPVGNEMNIIAGNLYATREGFAGLIERRTDITEYEPTIGIMKPAGEGWALVNCRARWKQNGEERAIGYDEKDHCDIQVKVNKFMGPDAVIGKTYRKLAARAYQRMSNIKIDDAEVEEIREVDAQVVEDKKKSKTERMKEELEEKAKEKTYTIHLAGPGLEQWEGALAKMGFKASFEEEGVFKPGLSVENHPEIVKLVLGMKNDGGQTVNQAIDAGILNLEVYEE